MGARSLGEDDRQTAGGNLLASLARNQDAIDARDIWVIVAHPDDETIGCGAQLSRWRDATLVTVTDGAPARGASDDATRARIARERSDELLHALQAGNADCKSVQLGIQDQTAAFHIVPLAIQLAAMLSSAPVRAVLTHAYEGGHPDHDAVAFATVLACALISAESHASPTLIEMPYYRAAGPLMVRQRFPARDRPDLEITLDANARERKLRMLAAHRSQADMLREFDCAQERFRIARTRDFRELPNDGELFYERFDWGLTGRDWRRIVDAAYWRLRMGPVCRSRY